MGKGDVKTRKGKIWRGSFGNTRRRKPNKPAVETTTTADKK